MAGYQSQQECPIQLHAETPDSEHSPLGATVVCLVRGGYRPALALQDLSNDGLRYAELTGDNRRLQPCPEGRSDGAGFPGSDSRSDGN